MTSPAFKTLPGLMGCSVENSLNRNPSLPFYKYCKFGHTTHVTYFAQLTYFDIERCEHKQVN